MILALCRCCLANPFYFYLLLRQALDVRPYVGSRALSFILFCSTLSLFLVLLLKLANRAISESSSFIREELSAFECGFDAHSLSRVPFSLRYFFLTIIFLLFDLEVVLLIFCPSVLFSSHFLFILVVVGAFVLVLIFSLFYELSDGTLD